WGGAKTQAPQLGPDRTAAGRRVHLAQAWPKLAHGPMARNRQGVTARSIAPDDPKRAGIKLRLALGTTGFTDQFHLVHGIGHLKVVSNRRPGLRADQGVGQLPSPD